MVLACPTLPPRHPLSTQAALNRFLDSCAASTSGPSPIIVLPGSPIASAFRLRGGLHSSAQSAHVSASFALDSALPASVPSLTPSQARLSATDAPSGALGPPRASRRQGEEKSPKDSAQVWLWEREIATGGAPVRAGEFRVTLGECTCELVWRRKVSSPVSLWGSPPVSWCDCTRCYETECYNRALCLVLHRNASRARERCENGACGAAASSQPCN